MQNGAHIIFFYSIVVFLFYFLEKVKDTEMIWFIVFFKINLNLYVKLWLKRYENDISFLYSFVDHYLKKIQKSITIFLMTLIVKHQTEIPFQKPFIFTIIFITHQYRQHF